MQNNNVNMVVFDEDESFITDQSRFNYNTRRHTQQEGLTSSQSPTIINNEIAMLNDKINALEEKASKIQEIIKSNNSVKLTDISNSVNNSSGNAQIEELLRVVETKIQVVVQETKKIIERMTGEFDKRISKSTSQKNHETNSISKIQAHCRDTITKVEQNYQEEINVIRNEHDHLEKRLIQRVEEIENQYKRKLKDFQNKEQEYINTIEHLENKLKMASKSKKMIDVTQPKPTSSIRTDHVDDNNSSQLSSQQFASSNAMSINDTSKRRTKIFDKNSNRSISPNNQVLSPHKFEKESKKETQSLAKPYKYPGESSKMSEPVYKAEPITNNYITESKQAYNQLRPNVVIGYSNPPSANIASVSSTFNNNQNQEKIMEQTSKEFLKDAPKVQWERFQDFNEEESDDEEDVFFYPAGQRESPKSAFGYDQNESDMQSPFDFK